MAAGAVLRRRALRRWAGVLAFAVLGGPACPLAGAPVATVRGHGGPAAKARTAFGNCVGYGAAGGRRVARLGQWLGWARPRTAVPTGLFSEPLHRP